MMGNRRPKRFFADDLKIILTIMVFAIGGTAFSSAVLADETTDAGEIQRLLTLGEELYAKYRYTNPQGEERNAVDVFQRVLRLDPNHEIAGKRLQQIEQYYLRKFAASTVESEKKLMAERALMANPKNEQMLQYLGIGAAVEEPAAVTEMATETEVPATPEQSVSVEEQQRQIRYQSYSESIVKALEEAIDFYRLRNAKDQTPVNQSIALLEQILKTEPNNYDALWLASRSILWLGDHSPEDKQVEIFMRGMDYGKKATEVNPNGIEGRYWYGSNMGKYGTARGIFKSLEYITPIVQEMEAILKLDPKHYKAITVLGILYRKAPPWPVSVGDIDKSEQFLRRSIANFPHSLHSHLELGITYNKLKKWDAAKAEFQKVIDMPFEDFWRPENEQYKEEAREILMMIRQKGY